DTATAAINLALLLGLPGSARSGYGTLTGQGNGQGGREHGQKADQLPGYRKITDPAARAHMAAVWGVPESLIPGPGVPAVQLLKSLGQPDGVRCLFVHGANVAVSAPDANAVIAGLRSLDFLVVCDFFLSETAAEADLILPVTQWAEEEGTLTNLEGRVLRRRRTIAPPPGVRSELWIMTRLAEALEAPSTFSEDPETVFEELRRASEGGLADYSGIDYAMLDRGEAAYWPYPAGSTGTPRLFLDAFAHADGRAVFTPVTPRRRAVASVSAGSAATADRAGKPMTLITGRLMEHYQSGAQTRRVAALAEAQPEARLPIHPAAAAAQGIADCDFVSISNGRGEVSCRAELSTDIRPETVFLPVHFPELESANRLTEAATDPISGMPEFKFSHVWVRPGGATLRANELPANKLQKEGAS
ncbi:MAG: molybdopterin dinucleotide binding domain-containing protein, partial [Arthrobacter sp.]